MSSEQDVEKTAHRADCPDPDCGHEIFGVEDWDECVGLLDEHLQEAHGTDIQCYAENGLSEFDGGATGR